MKSRIRACKSLSILIAGLLLVSSCEGSDSAQQSFTKAADADAVDPQRQLNTLAQNLKVVLTTLSNIPSPSCKTLTDSGLCYTASLTFTLDNDVTLDNWEIVFSHMTPILDETSDLFDIKHINGDIYTITATDKFNDWNAGTYEISLIAEFSNISEYNMPPNYYITAPGLESQIITSTIATIDPETQLEVLTHVSELSDSEKHLKRNQTDNTQPPTAEVLFRTNSSIEQKPAAITTRIIPQPTQVSASGKTIDISTGLNVSHNDFYDSVADMALRRLANYGLNKHSADAVEVKLYNNSKLTDQAYELNISETGIEIQASTAQGAFYGLQSVVSLYQPDATVLPHISVIDKPRYSFRGLHIDVSRNFRSKDFMIKMLDQMASLKLNKLHLHLGDDEGWRLEIPGLPELTQIGAWRCHDLAEQNCLLPQLGNGPASNHNNGFYTVEDYQEILTAAKQRFIEVIPSFDMPGHSRAAVVSMKARYHHFMELGQKELAEEYLLSDLNDQSIYSSIQHYNDNTLNVCREQTYHFIAKVIDEMSSMHKQVGASLKTYHIGADETPGAWTNSPQCQAFITENKLHVKHLSEYFISRVADIVSERGLQVAGWSDGLSEVTAEKLPVNTHANAWTPLFWNGHEVVNRMVNMGWDVVLSLPDVTYFDFPYSADPKERGYYWGSRYTDTRQVFEFMPDNLPLHAEIWTDRNNNPMILDDLPRPQQGDKASHAPIKRGLSVKGIQGQLWTEMIRSDDIAEYMLFPRLFSLAERAWHKPTWEPAYDYNGMVYSNETNYFSDTHKALREQDWHQFASALALREFSKLDRDGIFYRLPTVGASVVGDTLTLNTPFPGMQLEFQINNDNWINYSADNSPRLNKGDIVSVRTRTNNSDRYGRTLTLTYQ